MEDCSRSMYLGFAYIPYLLTCSHLLVFQKTWWNLILQFILNKLWIFLTRFQPETLTFPLFFIISTKTLESIWNTNLLCPIFFWSILNLPIGPKVRQHKTSWIQELSNNRWSTYHHHPSIDLHTQPHCLYSWTHHPYCDKSPTF